MADDNQYIRMGEFAPFCLDFRKITIGNGIHDLNLDFFAESTAQ